METSEAQKNSQSPPPDYFKIFYQHYSGMISDIMSTFSEYESVLAIDDNIFLTQSNFIFENIRNWENLRKQIATKNETIIPDLKMFAHIASAKNALNFDVADETEQLLKDIFPEIWAKSSEENKSILWRYIQTLYVYGAAVNRDRDSVKNKLLETIQDDEKFDESAVRNVTETAKNMIFKDNPKKPETLERKYMKRLFESVVNAVSLQLNGRNKKKIMDCFLSGKPNAGIDFKRVMRLVQPIINEIEAKLETGEVNLERFKDEAENIVSNLGSDVDGKGLAEMGISNDIMSKIFDGMPQMKYNYKEHVLPELPDLEEIKSKAKSKTRNRRRH